MISTVYQRVGAKLKFAMACHRTTVYPARLAQRLQTLGLAPTDVDTADGLAAVEAIAMTVPGNDWDGFAHTLYGTLSAEWVQVAIIINSINYHLVTENHGLKPPYTIETLTAVACEAVIIADKFYV